MASSNQFGWDRKHALKEADFNEKNLADEIGVKWKDLARALRFSQSSIDIIAKENIHSVKECCLVVLVSWLRQEGERATWGMMFEALVKIGLTNVAERFTCKPSDQSQNSEAVTVIRNLEMELAKTVSVRSMELQAELTKTVSARTMELEAEVDKMSARNKKLEAEAAKMSDRNKKLGDENSRQSARIKELEEMIQKNKAVLETVAVAVQEMEKKPEQRREDILKLINSEVQELLQQLKRVDVGNTDKCLVSSIDGKNIAKDKEPKNDLLGHDAKVPQQDEVHLLQSCEEQLSLYQGIFDAFIKLIPEVGELKDYNFESISKLCNFTKELKEQEKLFTSKIESLNKLKDTLNEDQTAELEKLARWYKAHKEQFDELEILLSMVLFQGRSTTEQRSKSDSSKHPSQSQTLRKLQNISGPFFPKKMCIMGTDKKPEEGQVSFGEPQSSDSLELFGATSTFMGQFEKGLKEIQGNKHNKSIKGLREAIVQRQKPTEDTISVTSKGSSTAVDQNNVDAAKPNRTVQSSEESINVDQEIKCGPSLVIHRKLSTKAPSKPTAKTGPKPTKQGFLEKLSGGKHQSKKWDKRYFELTDTGHLYYYKKAGERKPIKSIYLKGCPVEINPNDASVLIVKTEERDWNLKAVDFEEACAWRDALLFYSDKN